MSDAVHPFTAALHDTDIVDLRDRLRRTRRPDQLPGTWWELGTDVSFLRELCDHRADGFPFDARLAHCSRHPAHVRDGRVGVSPRS
jgi:Epoxide hydrolase N terminus